MTQDFIKTLAKVAPPLGMKFGNPKIISIADNRPASYIQALNQVRIRIHFYFRLFLIQHCQIIPMKPSIVMVVIPNNKGEHYAAIKKVCIMENPIPSQCITSTVLK